MDLMFEAPSHFAFLTATANPSAITTALIALAGALVGAVLSTGTQLVLARRQSRRDEAAYRKQIVIAARMMAVDLSRAESNIQYCVDHGEWWRTTGLSPRMTADDRRLILGELTPNGFYDVDRAEGAIDHWYGIREYELDQRKGYASLTITTQLDELRKIVGWIDAARAALRPLTGDPSSLEELVKPRRRRDEEAPVPRFINDVVAFMRARRANDATSRRGMS